jgi:hypothetical protein
VPYGQQQPLRPDREGHWPRSRRSPRAARTADLLDDYPGIDAPVIASRLGEILRCTAIELNAGRDVPIGIRRAVRHLADAVRVEMQPPT